MTQQLNPSTQPSTQPGKDCSPLKLAQQAQAEVDKRRKDAQISDARPSKPENANPTKSLKLPRAVRSDDEIKAESDKADALKAERKADSILAQSGLPKRHMGSHRKADDSEWGEASLKASIAYGMSQSVLLWGKRGTGKTQLAVELGRVAAKEGRSVKYYKAAQVFRLLRQAMQDGEEESELKHLAGVHLLIIDEAHVRGETDYEDRTLIELMDRRYDAMRPTVLITNLTYSEALTSLGESIVSRLTETGISIECNWQSFRGKHND